MNEKPEHISLVVCSREPSRARKFIDHKKNLMIAPLASIDLKEPAQNNNDYCQNKLKDFITDTVKSLQESPIVKINYSTPAVIFELTDGFQPDRNIFKIGTSVPTVIIASEDLEDLSVDGLDIVNNWKSAIKKLKEETGVK
ncbi:MAG: hypothetical protein ABEI53_02520 [Candidatus Magasanikbacteria bacterium]